MSVTKDGFCNIEGKVFEVVHGVEGDCLTLGDEDGGTRISGPKPWGGGQVTKTFVTKEKYGPIERLEEENAKLRECVRMLAKATVYDPCEWCQYDDDGTCDTETEPMRDGCRLYAELRLMGVEVDQWPI